MMSLRAAPSLHEPHVHSDLPSIQWGRGAGDVEPQHPLMAAVESFVTRRNHLAYQRSLR